MVTRLIFLALVLFFIGCAPTQTEQSGSRADVLWEMHEKHVEAAQAEYDTDEWENADSYRMVMTMSFEEEGERFETVATSTVDLANRRLISKTEAKGEYPFTTWMLYDGGDLTMLSDFDGELERNLLDEAQEAELAASFEEMFNLVDDMRDPATLEAMSEGEDTGRYDGYQRYGDVLAGEQVTLDLSQNPFVANLPGPGLGETSVIFTPEGLVAGQVTDTDTGRILMVFDEPTVLTNIVTGMTYTMYTLDGDEPVRQGDASMAFTLNPELDETTFELPEVSN